MRTLAITLLGLSVPCLLAAQQDTSRMHRNDSTRARNRTEHVSRGSISRSSGVRDMGLTSDQVRQLQTALKQDDCDPGTVDGLLGPHTRQAMACARQKNGVSGRNPNDLLRSLNLDFTVRDSTGMGGLMRNGRRGGRMSGSAADTTMGTDTASSQTTRRARANHRPRRMRADSTMHTRRDSTGRPMRGARPDTTLRKP